MPATVVKTERGERMRGRRTGFYERRKGREPVAACPVCGKTHEADPTGQVRQWHRIMLMRVPREVVEQWNRIRKDLLEQVKSRARRSSLRSRTIKLAASMPQGSETKRKLLAALKESYDSGGTERDGWNPGAVSPDQPWPGGEGSQMPPARDLQGLEVDQKAFETEHMAKTALHARIVSAFDRSFFRKLKDADPTTKQKLIGEQVQRAADIMRLVKVVMGDRDSSALVQRLDHHAQAIWEGRATPRTD